MKKKITKEELVYEFINSCQTGWIEGDNLSMIRLILKHNGQVVVENEHGAEFSIDDLSQTEREVFLYELM